MAGALLTSENRFYRVLMFAALSSFFVCFEFWCIEGTIVESTSCLLEGASSKSFRSLYQILSARSLECVHVDLMAARFSPMMMS